MTARAADNLPDLLAHGAARTPHAVAISDGAGRELTYGQLHGFSCRMAERLVAAGVHPGDRVAVCMPKSINAVISLLGAMRAGAAYVPIDYAAPAERNRYIARDCAVKAVCVDEPRATVFAWEDHRAERLVFPGEATSGVGAAWLGAAGDGPGGSSVAGSVRSAAPGSDDLAYILYTSGSTGVPKGVMHTHASALSFVRWAADTFRPTAADRFSSHAPFHFDLSILDLYVPMTAGASIVLVPENVGKDPRLLAPYIAENRITIWYSVPSILTLLAQHGNLPAHDHSALRTVLFAGEVFPIKHLRLVKSLWPAKEYYNLYGPTETNVCTYYRVPDDIDPRRETPYPIGRECENVRSLVVDEHDRVVPDGQEGQLLIHASGPTMRGYWNLPEASAKAFYVDAAGARWYRTGDVVRRNADGDFNFLGRRDRMVKRHGYRIELAEIERALYQHPEVREAAAIAVSPPDGVQIVAFLATKSGQSLSIIALKQFCAANLPAYMSPDRFQFLANLPRTSTDKIDYQSLMQATAGK